MNQGEYYPEDYTENFVKKFSEAKVMPLTIERPSPCETMTITQNRVESVDNYFTNLFGSSETFFTVENYKKLPLYSPPGSIIYK